MTLKRCDGNLDCLPGDVSDEVGCYLPYVMFSTGILDPSKFLLDSLQSNISRRCGVVSDIGGKLSVSIPTSSYDVHSWNDQVIPRKFEVYDC